MCVFCIGCVVLRSLAVIQRKQTVFKLQICKIRFTNYALGAGGGLVIFTIVWNPLTPPPNINECDVTKSPCGQNSKCINTAGSFECRCDKGFKHIPDRCVDIDECKTGGHVCDINAYCYNVPGKNSEVDQF